MLSRVTPATILVVDDDDTVLQVLGRVLRREGHTVLEAASVAQALETAGQYPLDLALLDLSLPNGNGVDLGQKLRARQPDLRMILMTAYPLRLRDYPDETRPFARVLTKPADLSELREAVATALVEETMHPSLPTPHSEFPATVPTADAPPYAAAASPNGAGPVAVSAAPPRRRFAWVSSAAAVAIVVVILAAFVVFVADIPLFSNPFAAAKEPDKEKANAGPSLPAVELVPGKPHTLYVPQDVRASLGIRKAGVDIAAVSKVPKQSRPLVLPGSTMLDPARIMRIRVRYTPADVKKIGEVRDEEQSSLKGRTIMRQLRTGDRVERGDLLAVLYSTDLGQKKNDLIDALVALKLDKDVLARTKEAYDRGAVPAVQVVQAKRAVEGDLSLIGRAVNTMRTWNIAEKDIQAAYDEAEKISEREGQRDPEKEKLWPRAELRAPDDGVIIERNVGAPGETWVDNTQNLFQIAKVDRMLVVANCPEDDLPTLVNLQKKHPELMRWTVRTVGVASASGLSGTIDEIGYLIDPNQHTAVIKGYIENPGEQIRGTQFVSCTVNLPPPDDVVEIPVDALVDDGKQALVFVETDADRHYYTMRRVQVTHRFEKTVFVRSSEIPEQELTSGAWFKLTDESLASLKREKVPESVLAKLKALKEKKDREFDREQFLEELANALDKDELKRFRGQIMNHSELGVLPKEPLPAGTRILQNGVGELKAALLKLESQPEQESKEEKH